MLQKEGLSKLEQLEDEIYQIGEELKLLAGALRKHLDEYANPVGSGRSWTDAEVDSGKHLAQIANEDVESTLKKIEHFAAQRRELLKQHPDIAEK